MMLKINDSCASCPSSVIKWREGLTEIGGKRFKIPVITCAKLPKLTLKLPIEA
jgi:hypothetical protein